MQKENVTDYYVRRILVTGYKLKMHQLPKELIETKQALIKIKRKVDKMNAPLKTCNKHGKLYREAVIKAGLKPNGDQAWRCKACMAELHKNNYQLNKIKINARNNNNKKERPEHYAMVKKKSRIKNRFKKVRDSTLTNSYARHVENAIRVRKNNMRPNKPSSRDNSEILSDKYIKHLLTKRSGLKNDQIPQSLIECKRVLVQLQRGIRKRRDEEIFNYLEGTKHGKD